MPPKKKGSFAKHTGRVGSRVGERAKRFVVEARAGIYDQTRLAQDIGASVMDVAEFWGGLFGMRGSPSGPVLELGSWPAATWAAAPGVTMTVVIEDPVPDDRVWPIGGLRLVRLGPPGAPGNINLVSVTEEDEESLQLRVNFRDAGGPPPAGEYYGTLTYTSVTNPHPQGSPWFAAFVKGLVT